MGEKGIQSRSDGIKGTLLCNTVVSYQPRAFNEFPTTHKLYHHFNPFNNRLVQAQSTVISNEGADLSSTV